MSFNPNLFGINIGQEFQSGLNNFDGYNSNTPYSLSNQVVSLIQNDIRYLKSLGFTRFRLASPDYSWAGRLTYYHDIIEVICQEGNLHLEWGVGVPYGHKPSNWAGLRDTVDAEITFFEDIINTYASNGITGVWIVGNENDPYWAIGETEVVSNITRVSNVVTVTFPFTHTLLTGDSVRISGSAVVTPGGVFHTIQSVPSPTTITINHTGSDASENGGKLYYTPSTTRNHIRRLGQHFKNDLGIEIPLAYSCPQGQGDPYYYTKPWRPSGGNPQEGQEGIDHVDLNVYSAGNSNLETNWIAFKDQIDEAYELFGTTCRITEWNNYEDDTTARVPNDNPALRYRYLRQRKEYIESYGMAHYFFAYRMPGKLAEKYPAYNNRRGGIRPSFFKLIGKRSPYMEIVPQ